MPILHGFPLTIALKMNAKPFDFVERELFPNLDFTVSLSVVNNRPGKFAIMRKQIFSSVKHIF